MNIDFDEFEIRILWSLAATIDSKNPKDTEAKKDTSMAMKKIMEKCQDALDGKHVQ